MKFSSLLAAALLFVSAAAGRAQVPPAEQLLPDDSIALVTVPSWKKLSALEQTAWSQLWHDGAMKPFRDNFVSNFQSDLIQPLEKELGVKLGDYKDLLQGQVTLALTPPKAESGSFAGLLLILDTGEKSELLAAKLAELKKKWTEAGKELRVEKIRDVEFSIVAVAGGELGGLLKKVIPFVDSEDDEEEEGEKAEWYVGQVKTLLVAGENPKAIEKFLARQAGGLVAPLAERADYQKAHAELFRDSLGHAWVDLKPIYQKLLAFAQGEPAGATGMPAFRMDKLLPALGIGALEMFAGKVSVSTEGTSVELLAAVPEARREGIFKMLTIEKKDAAPPAFVPADVLRFQRTRIDAQKAWTVLENMLTQIDPSLAGLLQLMLASAGKDKDAEFDLKKSLIGNLGDDFIQYQKAPKEATLAGLQNAPGLILVGSPNPTQLVDAVRTVSSMLPPPLSSAPLKEREFLGRKVYSFALGAPAEEGGEAPSAPNAPNAPQTFSFTSSGGYLAFATDASVLEEYLRSAENPPKPLRAVSGLAEAAQKAGGLELGYFTFENQAESMRLIFKAVRSDPAALKQAFLFGRGEMIGGEDSILDRLFNPKLLPEFDRVAKFFHFTVGTGATTPDGYRIRFYEAHPPGLAR